MLADYAGNQLIFINIVDLASGFTMVGTVTTRHPSVVFARLLQVWITPFGAPTRVIFDGGGEFEREFSKELEDMGCQLMTTAGATPQQNATVERHSGLFKTHARKLIDQFSIRFDKPEQAHKIQWMLASVCWAMNSAVNQSGYSLSQWVLGRGLRLPYVLMDNAGRLSLHERVVSDKASLS